MDTTQITPEQLLGELSCPEWLKSQVDLLTRDGSSGYSAVVAAGLVARLWNPGYSGQAKELVDDLYQGQDNLPSTKVRSWAKGLSQEELDWVTRSAIAEADVTGTILGGLCCAVTEDRLDLAGDVALDLLQRRDDLECVQYVLQAAGVDALSFSLSGLDSVCKRHERAFAAAQIEPTSAVVERLRAMATENPEGLPWWAKHVSGLELQG